MWFVAYFRLIKGASVLNVELSDLQILFLWIGVLVFEPGDKTQQLTPLHGRNLPITAVLFCIRLLLTMMDIITEGRQLNCDPQLYTFLPYTFITLSATKVKCDFVFHCI